MTGEERTGDCICCRKRNAHEPPVCGPCRSRAALQLREIPLLCELLAAGPRPEVSREGVLVSLAAGPISGVSNAPRVAGSRERPLPIRADALDLLAPPRVPSLTLTYRGQLDDQVGTLSAATILDGWCRDWSETRREHTPEPVVARQCSWLLDRLDWAFAEHPAVDEFTVELGDLWAVLRRACGLTMPRPELVQGVPCRSMDCDLKTLYRVPGSEFVECSSCGGLMTETELQAWCKLLTAAARRKT